MLQLSFQDFALLIDYVNKNKNHKTENRSTLYRAIHQQILAYKNLHVLYLADGSEAVGEAAQVHSIFERVVSETTVPMRSRESDQQVSDPVSNSFGRYKQMPKGTGRGDWEFTIAIYYWFHRDDARAAFARKIDDAVFGLPFHEKFHLSRDQYTPLDLDERDFAVGPLRFSTDDSAATLYVHTEPRGSILDGGHPSPSRALSWQYGLTEMIGRDSQKTELLDWAMAAPGEIRLRLLSGAGGSGKTRLASDVASELSKQRTKWNAGFLAKEADEIITIHTPAEGVLIIIDYPEERMAFVERLIEGLRNRSDAHISVRVLLLSRLDPSHWEHASRALEHRFSVQAASATGPLELNDALALVDNAYQELSSMTKTQPAMPDGAEAWLKADRMHRLPLFATAAALHAFLAPRDAFGLNGAKIVEALAKAERDRVRSYSRASGLDEFGLERLLALASISPAGLLQSAIEVLPEAGLPLGKEGQALVDALGKTPWWSNSDGINDGVLHKLLPDRLAVAFIALTLLNSKMTDLPRWMSVALKPAGSSVGAVLSRLMFDLAIHKQEYRDVLKQSASLMLDQPGDMVEQFRDAVYRDQTFLSAPLLIEVIQRLLEQTSEPDDRAALLHNLGLHHHRVDEVEAALAAYEASLRIRRRFARWPWSSPDRRRALALTLSNYANCLRDAGREEKADAVMRKSLRIRLKLAQSGNLESLRQAAVSLATSANVGTASGRHDQALADGKLAVAICRQIAERDPTFANQTLALALHNSAKSLAVVGDYKNALANLREAVGIRRELSARQPDYYLEKFGLSLNDLSRMLLRVELDDDALAAALEALEVYSKLNLLSPALYAADMAAAHLNVGTSYLFASRINDALVEAKLSEELFKQYGKGHDADHTIRRAEAMLLVANCESELGNPSISKKKATSAVMLLSAFKGHNHNVLATLAKAHSIEGMAAAQLDDFDEAVPCLDKAVTVYQELFDGGNQSVKPFIDRLTADMAMFEAMKRFSSSRSEHGSSND